MARRAGIPLDRIATGNTRRVLGRRTLHPDGPTAAPVQDLTLGSGLDIDSAGELNLSAGALDGVSFARHFFLMGG